MIKKIFLNESIIIAAIILNVITVFATESGLMHPALAIVDLATTLFFVGEMAVKHAVYGPRQYWRSAWDRFDGILVILSLPAIASLFTPLDYGDLSTLLAFRMLRVVRVFRVARVFPGFSRMMRAMRQAMAQCYSILVTFAVVVLVFALVNCAFFREVAPEYFDTPVRAVYTIFRLCTIEGWYEIPEAVAQATPPVVGGLVRFYFSALLILGGIIGMSFINSIFVDAMVSDNNDAVEQKIDELTRQISELRKTLEEKKE